MHLQDTRVYIYYTKTGRPNIKYQIKKFSDPAVLRNLVKNTRQKNHTIIYYHIITIIKIISNQLNCNIYYNSYKAKTATFKGFTAAKYGIITATNTLNLKINIPNVYTMLHISLPHNLTDYIQKNVLASLNNNLSSAIIFNPHLKQAPKNPDLRK